MSGVFLSKDMGEVSLFDDANPDGTAIETLELGLSWDAKGEDKSLRGRVLKARRKAEGKANPGDMDGLAVFYAGERPVKYVGFDNTDCFRTESAPGANGSAVHSGDNTTGEGEGDDETITLYLTRLPARITRVTLVAGAAKNGADIKSVDNITVKLYDRSNGAPVEMAVMEPSLLNPKRMIAVARLDRVPGTLRWKLSVIDDGFDITPGDMNSLLVASQRMV